MVIPLLLAELICLLWGDSSDEAMPFQSHIISRLARDPLFNVHTIKVMNS